VRRMKQESIKQAQARRKKEAVLGIGWFVLIQLVCTVCFASLCFIPDAPVWVVVLFAVLAAVCILLLLPALWALRARWKEIEGGELDAAAEY